MYPMRIYSISVSGVPAQAGPNFEAAEVHIELCGCYEYSTKFAKTEVQRLKFHTSNYWTRFIAIVKLRFSNHFRKISFSKLLSLASEQYIHDFSKERAQVR